MYEARGQVRPRIIGVGGGSFSGKTYLAELLRDLLGFDSCLIINADSLQLDGHKFILEQLIPTPFVIIEGALVLVIDEIRRLCDFRIFVDTPDSLRYQRAESVNIIEQEGIDGSIAKDRREPPVQGGFPTHSKLHRAQTGARLGVAPDNYVPAAAIRATEIPSIQPVGRGFPAVLESELNDIGLRALEDSCLSSRVFADLIVEGIALSRDEAELILGAIHAAWS